MFFSFCGGSDETIEPSTTTSTTSTATDEDTTTTSTTSTTTTDEDTITTSTTSTATDEDTTTTSTTSTTTSTTSTTTSTTIPLDYPQLTISEISNSIPDYNRDDWNHWIDENSDCQNTRHEVLIEESQETVTYTSDTFVLSVQVNGMDFTPDNITTMHQI